MRTSTPLRCQRARPKPKLNCWRSAAVVVVVVVVVVVIVVVDLSRSMEVRSRTPLLAAEQHV